MEDTKNISSGGFADTFTIAKPSGGYDITGGKKRNGSIMFMFPNKPKWHHRLFCKLLLGWTWLDE